MFVSSTFRDLRPERQAVIDVLRRAQFVPWGMELFASEPSKPLDVALRELELSDAVVLLIGFRAGSLIPDSPGLTYTAAEFHRAKELGRRIFVFIQTEGGVWLNKETAHSLKVALDDFKKAVQDSNITPAYFENSDRLEIEVLVAFDKWNADGRPGARLTFTTPEEFFAPYRSVGTSKLFDYNQTLRGRATEIEALQTFMNSSQLVVGILTGRGGIGKSKLLHDWTRGLSKPRVLYVRDDAVWHPEAAKEIPAGDVLIIADDVHRLAFLDQMLSLVRILRQRQNIKIILGTRPSGLSQIDASLAIRFETDETERFPALRQITNANVIALAEEILGPEHVVQARALAAVSADTPLITVVGGRLIARGEIAPELLTNEDDFRHAVFDRLSAEYERLLPPGSVNWRSLLNLIAALGPLAPKVPAFLNGASELLKVRSDEIMSAIDILETHGLLLRAGRLVRIVPDLLSDFLLEGACLTKNGDPTGFADEVFHRFRSDYLSNILRNLSELDWRITHRDKSSSLLDQIWREIESSFEAAAADGRVQLLKTLTEAALFQPSRVIRLVHRAIESQAVTTNLSRTWQVTQDDVLRTLPPLLGAIGHHLDHFEEAVRMLWELARRDIRDANRYPEDAWRVLEELAEYGRYKPVALNDCMAEFSIRQAREPGAFEGPHTPLDIADKLLAKEGQFTDADGYSFSFGGFGLHYPNVKNVRDKSISFVKDCLNSTDNKIALRAVASLSKILAGYLPMGVRNIPAEELAWQNEERLTALQIIEDRLRRSSIPAPVLRQIHVILRENRPRTKGTPLAPRINEVLALVSQTDELLIFDAFCTGQWSMDPQFENLEDADRSRSELVRKGVNAYRSQCSTPQEQVEGLAGLVTEAESAGVDLDSKPVEFIQELCTDQTFLREFISYLLNDPHPLLAQLIYVPLRLLRNSDATQYHEVGLRAASHENVYVVLGTANSVSYGPGLITPIKEDLEILRPLSQHPNWRVRFLTFTGIGRIGAHVAYERDAINLLLRMDVGSDPILAEEMCGAVDYAHINLANLPEADIRNLLEKLLPTKEIERHHTGRVLGLIGRTFPSALCEFIIKRLDLSAAIASSDGGSDGYVPVPHHHFGGFFHALQGGPPYREFLQKIRDRFVADQTSQRYWLRELFWSIGTLDVTTLAAVDELIHSDKTEEVQAAIELLGSCPQELALSHPFFTIHVIDACACLRRDLGEAAVSTIISNCHVGSFNRATGQPSPRYLAMKDRSIKLRDVFQPGSIGHKLFSKLNDSVVAALDRERTQDDEMGFL
jgi:hypothetical protein